MLKRLLLLLAIALAPALAHARTFTVALSAGVAQTVLDDQAARTWARLTNVGANAANCSRIVPATTSNGPVLAASGNLSTSVLTYGAESVPGQAVSCISTAGTTLLVETVGDHGPTPTPTPAPTPTP